MYKDFQEELRKIIQRNNEIVPSMQKEILTTKTKYQKEIIESEPLYNIQKRSLPTGLDKTVVFNVTKKEAELLLKIRFKTKIENNKDGEGSTVIYYDRIRSDGFRIGVFDNPKEIAINWEG